jgi:hypothetical protein
MGAIYGSYEVVAKASPQHRRQREAKEIAPV